jgi:hypothetical protein
MIYDDFAEALRREYEVFLLALTGRYLSLTSAGVQASPHTIGELRRAGAGLQGMFLQHASAAIDNLIGEYPSARANERASAFKREIERMSDTNIESLIDRMKGAAMNPQAVGEVHGAMGLLLQQRMAQPEYRVPTKSGRSYEAKSLMYGQARDFGYRVWIDETLSSIAVLSDLAEVQYPDPNHAGNGMVFSVSGETPGYPSFAGIENEVFHYNAQAMIVPHVPL